MPRQSVTKTASKLANAVTTATSTTATSTTTTTTTSGRPLTVARVYRHFLKAGYAAVQYSHLARPDIRNYIRARFDHPHGSSVSLATSSTVTSSSRIKAQQSRLNRPSPSSPSSSSTSLSSSSSSSAVSRSAVRPGPVDLLPDRRTIYNTLSFLHVAADKAHRHHHLAHKVVHNIAFVTHHRPSYLWNLSRVESGGSISSGGGGGGSSVGGGGGNGGTANTSGAGGEPGHGGSDSKAATVSRAMFGWERAIEGLNARFGMCL